MSQPVLPSEEPSRQTESPAPPAGAPPIYQMQPGFENPPPYQPPPPELDEHLRKITPTVWVTYALMAINALVFVLMIVKGVSPTEPTVADLIAWGGSLPERNYGGEPWRLFTACFLHSGIIHIAANMYGLLILGQRTERMVGPWGFLIAYLASGVVGEIVSSVASPNLVSVGASGAIFGVMGLQLAILITHPESPLQQALKNASWSMLGYLGVNLFIGFTQPGIDNAAHIGGLVAGFLGGFVLSQPLEVDAVDHRWWRNACLAAAALVAIGAGYLGAHSYTESTIEWLNAVKDFVAAEKKALDAFQEAIRKAEASPVTFAELGERIEQEVAFPWNKLTAKLHATHEPPGKQAEFRRLLLVYVDVRQKAWEAYVLACREPDPMMREDKFREFKRLDGDVADALEDVNSFSRPKK